MGEQLYEVTVVIRAYAIAVNEEEAQEIIDASLMEIVADITTDMRAQRATRETLDPAWRDAYPWSSHGEGRTCQQILDTLELDARQIGLDSEA